MGAIYGILGDANPSELKSLGQRLLHRGGAGAEWSLSPTVHLGVRGTSAVVERVEHGILVFDGAIDNRAALARLLKRPANIPLPVEGDSDLVLELFSRRGTDGFQEIAGQFALALWDGVNRRLILARDRIGYAPLYFTAQGGRIIFASEYKALLALEDVPARPNRQAIQVIQSTKWVQPGVTCLEGIYPVAPGSWMAIEHNRIHSARFGDIPIQVLHQDDELHIATLRSAFLETLRRQTEPYLRIGISLSGGLDSALMAAGARHVIGDKELHSFTAGYGEDDKELINAAKVADELGTHHHALLLDPDELPELLPWMVWHLEEPIGREDIAYLFIAAREAARHVDLVLTGFGFDGLFAGLPRHRVAHVALQLPLIAGPLREFYDYSVRGIEPRSWSGRALKHAYFRGSDFPAPSVLGSPPLMPVSDFGGRGDQPLSRFLRNGFLLLPYQSAVERLYTAAGVRFNAHHTDPAFIRAAFSIPDRLKIRRRTQKFILRKACSGLLPESMLSFGKSFNRLKHNLQLSAVLDQLADEFLPPAQVADRGLFEPSYVARLRRRRQQRPYSQERVYRLWSLLLTEMWSRMYLDGRGLPPSTTTVPLTSISQPMAAR
jgi:asparagine synthase (glutamine-hydrolysing)